jgi:hypothetical protein
MNAAAKQEEKLSALLKELEDSPSVKTHRADKAAAILATRTEAAGKIEAVKKEREIVLPELLADRDTKEELIRKGEGRAGRCRRRISDGKDCGNE